MASPSELRAAIVENRAQLQAALHGAHAKWQQKPDAAAGEEDSWSPREVVEHMVGAEWTFTNMIAQACGAPAGARPTVDAATPAAAAASVTHVGATCDNILRHVSVGDMEKTFEHPRMGLQTVGQMLDIIVSHGENHVHQLRGAASA